MAVRVDEIGGAQYAKELSAIREAAFGKPYSPPGGARRVVAAFLDGELAGYGEFATAADTAEIIEIAVDERFRRRSAGRAIVERIAELAKDSGATRVQLELRESNRAAKRLYLSAGFLQDGIRKNYYRAPAEDAILMHRGD